LCGEGQLPPKGGSESSRFPSSYKASAPYTG